MPFLTILLAFLAGILSHGLYFNHGEHHLYALSYLNTSLGILAFSTYIQTLLDRSLATSSAATLLHASVFLLGLTFSLLVYRAFLNPLNDISGPIFARISRLSLVARVARRHNAHHLLRDLHHEHGSFVRTGPNDVSTIHPDAMQVLHGPRTTMTKAPFYDADYPQYSLNTTRIRSDHDMRRRFWIGAFSDKALRGYEARIEIYVSQLVGILQGTSGQSTDATKWFKHFTFDVMGDLAFGSSFNMLTSGEAHWVTETIAVGISAFGFALPNWLFRLAADIPPLHAPYQKMADWCATQISLRMQKDQSETPDIAHHLIEAMQKRPDRVKAMSDLANDAKLIIIAGSDTTSATLTHLFFYLAADQDLQCRLRQAIIERSAGDTAITNLKLQDLELLNCCISETLRLNPPVPSGLPRLAPPEGVIIGNTFIPGGTSVQIPSYVVGHDENTYALPEQFLPERWSTQPDLIKIKDAFAPFGIGSYGCIGRNLALMEIRLLAARLLLEFDISLADGEDGRALFEESKDHFTLAIDSLRLCFSKRP